MTDIKPTKSKEIWENHKKQMKWVASKRQKQFLKAIEGMENEGIEVIKMSQDQFRLKVKTPYVNEEIDFFPHIKGYHDIVRNEKGKIEGEWRSFIRQLFGLK